MLMRVLLVFYFQVNYMHYWRLHFEKEILVNCLFTQWKWAYILDFGPWKWSALNMGYMDKQPSRMQRQARSGRARVEVGHGWGAKALAFFGDAPARRSDVCNARRGYLESPPWSPYTHFTNRDWGPLIRDIQLCDWSRSQSRSKFTLHWILSSRRIKEIWMDENHGILHGTKWIMFQDLHSILSQCWLVIKKLV